MVKGETGKKNLDKLVQKRNEMRAEIISLINDAKDLDPDEKRAQYMKASKLYTELRKHESNKIKKNSHFNTPEGRKGLKRFTPAGDTQVLVDKKGKLKEGLFKILNEGIAFEAKSIRGKKQSGEGAGAASADDDGGSQTSTASQETNVAEDPDFDELEPPPKKGGFGDKQGKLETLEEEEVEPKGDVQPAPPAPIPGAIEAAENDSREHMRVWLNTIKEDEISGWAQVYEAGMASDSKANHEEKAAAAYHQMTAYLGAGFEGVPKEQRDLMFKYYYASAHVNDAPEASQPTQPDVNNDSPGATPQSEAEAFSQDDINNLTIEDGPTVPPVDPAPDVSNDPAAQSTTFSSAQTAQDAPEFQPFNPPVNNVNIEIDDTGSVPPMGSGIPMTGGGAALPNASMLTSSSLLNSVNFPTDVAQQMVEDRLRAKKTINQLKEEIRALHLVYDDNIPSFKQNPHLGQKNDALKSDDIKVVRAHHKNMEDTIRKYYKTSDLKVGVILSAEGFFGSGAGVNPNLAALTQPRVPEMGGNVRVSRPGHEFDNAVAGETRVNRLGRNYRKPVSRNVPKVGFGTTKAQIREPQQTADVERPLRGQRGFRSRRITTGMPGMTIKLKTGKK